MSRTARQDRWASSIRFDPIRNNLWEHAFASVTIVGSELPTDRRAVDLGEG